ncbi:MAG: PspC domain-containing protein [Thermococcus sp.]|uniref:Transcriptional regulator n=1 Tax=Thermococcus guaymasensis DSM 11113 TaxID=1432656 RepID=A0A0X1KLW9_9EURY|nr:PspC domain-containing protein [Thermococcus guaymasensis]AJC72259.1 transcriptional regulator [Thermococcus guaymasensis DSM 11113]MCD6524695.1 PspC domain-containing protein [Thermococcus sp.]
MDESTKKLTRSRKNRVFFGVVGGLAEYLNIDPTLLRVILVVLLVFNPFAMILLYFLLALVIPEENREERPLGDRLSELAEETEKRVNEIISSGDTRTLAIILIVLGATLVAKSFLPLIIRPVDETTLLAIVLLIMGAILLVEGD